MCSCNSCSSHRDTNYYFSISSGDFHYPHTFTSYTNVDISFSIHSANDKMDENDDYEDYDEVPRPFNFDSNEPLVIAANEAEVEEEYSDDDYFANEFTTKVSVESSVNVISNLPKQDEEEDYDMETKKSGLITKEDFIKDAAIANVANIMDVMVSSNDIQMSATELPNTELKVMPEADNADTELHHEVLLKLRNKIKNGKHWLDDFTSAVREIRKAM